jgi:hypothetical protein
MATGKCFRVYPQKPLIGALENSMHCDTSTPRPTADRQRGRGIDYLHGQGNRSRGCDRIVGALANLGYQVSNQTVGNVLRRYGRRRWKRMTTWAEFSRTRLALLAGTDFFTAEVLTWSCLVTSYVLFFIHLESAGLTLPGSPISRTSNGRPRWPGTTMEGCSVSFAYRDTKYSAASQVGTIRQR